MVPHAELHIAKCTLLIGECCPIKEVWPREGYELEMQMDLILGFEWCDGWVFTSIFPYSFSSKGKTSFFVERDTHTPFTQISDHQHCKQGTILD